MNFKENKNNKILDLAIIELNINFILNFNIK